jgi:ABC-type polysaccharide/polyol phosphate transport system ATPase subunit
MIQELCDRAIWLERGELVDSGSIVRVSEAYAARMAATV